MRARAALLGLLRSRCDGCLVGTDIGLALQA